jgi:hypothetical protein
MKTKILTYYLLGYGVTATTYFCKYVHEVKEAHELTGVLILALYSGLVGLSSWFYVAARFINTVCN